jgi:hypothetical protein
VLFIVIFAALIRAAAVQHAAAAQTAKPAPPAPPSAPVKLEVAQLHAQAVANVSDDIASRPTVIVRISAAGSITAIERVTVDKASTASSNALLPLPAETLESPLLEHSPDPDIALAYLGDRAADLRVCRVVAVHQQLSDLNSFLIIFAPDKPLADLPHALVEGLRRDVERCLHDQQGLAVIVDPTMVAKPARP